MKLAILGFGTVGKGVYEILQRKETKDTSQLEATHIFVRKGREKTLPIMCDDYDSILADPNCQCVVEVMGGIEPAHTYIIKALRAGKHVVTANKAVVAAHLEEFLKTAKQHQVQFRFEASCAGGIPWIHSLRQAKRVDPIHAISGIFNGTANYIIDQMVKKDLDFETALIQAQAAGYAEADPSADIDGIDTANKAMISASLAFDTICTRDFAIGGIRHLQKKDLQTFLQHGYSVRLMMEARCVEDRYAITVAPTILSTDTLEAHVPDNFNLTTLIASTLGELKLYGQGAGALPTGNAIVSDLIAIAREEWEDAFIDQQRQYDPSLLKGDYLIRMNDHYQILKDVTPPWVQAYAQNAQKEDPTLFWARIATKGEQQ